MKNMKIGRLLSCGGKEYLEISNVMAIQAHIGKICWRPNWDLENTVGGKTTVFEKYQLWSHKCVKLQVQIGL